MVSVAKALELCRLPLLGNSRNRQDLRNPLNGRTPARGPGDDFGQPVVQGRSEEGEKEIVSSTGNDGAEPCRHPRLGADRGATGRAFLPLVCERKRTRRSQKTWTQSRAKALQSRAAPHEAAQSKPRLPPSLDASANLFSDSFHPAGGAPGSSFGSRLRNTATAAASPLHAAGTASASDPASPCVMAPPAAPMAIASHVRAGSHQRQPPCAKELASASPSRTSVPVTNVIPAPASLNPRTIAFCSPIATGSGVSAITGWTRSSSRQSANASNAVSNAKQNARDHRFPEPSISAPANAPNTNNAISSTGRLPDLKLTPASTTPNCVVLPLMNEG
jgi:hypothetical protein